MIHVCLKLEWCRSLYEDSSFKIGILLDRILFSLSGCGMPSILIFSVLLNHIFLGVAVKSYLSSTLTYIYTPRVTSSAGFSDSSVINQRPVGNGSMTSALAPYRTSITTKTTSMTTQFLSPMNPIQIQKTGTVTKTSEKHKSPIISSPMTASSNHSSQKMTPEITISTTPVNFIPSSSAEKSGHSVTSVINSSLRERLKTTTAKTTTAKTTCANEEKVFGWHVKPGMSYIALASCLKCRLTNLMHLIHGLQSRGGVVLMLPTFSSEKHYRMKLCVKCEIGIIEFWS